MPDGPCFRCKKPGHWADKCPELLPPADKAEHEARIAEYIRRWTDGEIDVTRKRQMIAAENEMWKQKAKVNS